MQISPGRNTATFLGLLAIALWGTVVGLIRSVSESFGAIGGAALIYTVGSAAQLAAAEDITAALEDGVFPVGEDAGLPLTWFPLEETAAAHDAVENGTTGKVLIRVDDELASQ